MPVRPTVWRMRSGPSCRDWGNGERARSFPWPAAGEGVASAALRPGAGCRVAHTAARTAGITSRASRCAAACRRGSAGRPSVALFLARLRAAAGGRGDGVAPGPGGDS